MVSILNFDWCVVVITVLEHSSTNCEVELQESLVMISNLLSTCISHNFVSCLYITIIEFRIVEVEVCPHPYLLGCSLALNYRCLLLNALLMHHSLVHLFVS